MVGQDVCSAALVAVMVGIAPAVLAHPRVRLALLALGAAFAREQQPHQALVQAHLAADRLAATSTASPGAGRATAASGRAAL